MTKNQSIQFVELLEMFISDCGLDRVDACNKAQELLDLINE